MTGTLNSWASKPYHSAGVPECPQQWLAWLLREKHLSQTSYLVPDWVLVYQTKMGFEAPGTC